MRRKRKDVPNRRSRALVYTCAVVALSVYAIPNLPKLNPGMAGTFSTVWILFAALAAASNLYFLFGADKERSRMLEIQDAQLPTKVHSRLTERRERGRVYQ